MNSTKKQARFAGLLYQLASLPAHFALIYVPGKLIVPGDAVATADHIRASETLFRLGIASELFGFIIFIFVVLALYRLFKAVDKKHALAMATLILISIPSRFSMCSTKSLHWFSPAAPSFCRYLKRVSWMPWPICSSVCMARDLSLRKSSGGFGCFRLGLLLFDRVSSHVCWAFYCSLQVSAMWRVPLLLSFHYLTPLLL